MFIARLNSDGSLDRSLDPGPSFTDPFGGVPFLQSIIVQPDGKLLVAGFFDSYQGAPRFSLARLLANGALDTAFDIGTGFTSSSDPSTPAFLNGLVLQHDGRIIVTGGFDLR